jgi:hypothetical protein
MEDIKTHIVRNKFALIIGVLAYIMFLYFSYEGNRICDCQSTQKYQNGNTSHHGSTINRFYHK